MPSLVETYEARTPLLEHVCSRLGDSVTRHFDGMPRIDRISFRVKNADSFEKKVDRNAKTDTKYTEPLVEVEDQVAGRILVFFLSDVEPVLARLPDLFPKPVESTPRTPAVDAEFGYESHHQIYSIPNWAFPEGWTDRDDVPDMFELQVRTLFQHAYAEPQHDVGYKDSDALTSPQRRELAWVAASAWGADKAFERLHAALQRG